MEIRGPTWNTMSEILLEILRSGRGGFVLLEGGSRKGGSYEHPNPPGYGHDIKSQTSIGTLVTLVCAEHAPSKRCS